ncbi:hypothetical protein [Terrabacter sp. NPDC080008]|uniref:hypothetical protein n=1 Tax=Terrabacter sp. NPDC080008 TaxID=3155176 RepID=UPI00344E47D9
MALLGVILLLLGAAVGVLAYVATHAATTTVAITALGLTRDASPFELVLYGAAAMLLLALGWSALSAAVRRRARLRREEKERARVAEIEQDAENTRREHEQRLQDAGLRDEDLRRRENELAARHEGLDTRESELTHREEEISLREAELREREQPSVADVVTGRAHGNVHEGTASWHHGSDTNDTLSNDTVGNGMAGEPTDAAPGEHTAYGDGSDHTTDHTTDHATETGRHDGATAADDERTPRDSSV